MKHKSIYNVLSEDKSYSNTIYQKTYLSLKGTVYLLLFSIFLITLSSSVFATTFTDTPSQPYTAVSAGTSWFGYNISVNENINITSVGKKNSTDGSTDAIIMNSACQNLSVATFVGDVATFASPVNLTKGGVYYVYVGSVGNKGLVGNASATYPQTINKINYTSGMYYNGVACSNQVYTYGVYNITYSNGTASPAAGTDPNVCYQETATSATTCGGLNTGSYNVVGSILVNPTWAYDGDFTSAMNGTNPSLFVNYTIPGNFTGAIWRYSIYNGTDNNLSIPAGCFGSSGQPLQLLLSTRTTSLPNSAALYCYSYSAYSWLTMLDPTTPSSTIFEEGVYWLGQNVFLSVYNASSGNLTGNTTFTLYNSTTQVINSSTNGQMNFSMLNTGSLYTVIINSTGFQTSTFAFIYNQSTPTYSYYLYPNTSTNSLVTFTVLFDNNKPALNSQVTIETFINGTYKTIKSGFVDIGGNFGLNQTQGTVYRITTSLNGYITQQDISVLTQATYTTVLVAASQTDPSQTGAGTGITYSFTPMGYNVSTNIQTFTFTTTPLLPSTNVTLTSMNLFDMYGNNLSSNGTNTNGTVYLYYNTTPYNGSTLFMVLTYQKDGYTTYSITNVYTVSSNNFYIGTIDEARTYALQYLTLGERAFIWIFGIIACALGLYSLGARGAINSMGSMGFGVFFGYMLAINPIILTIYAVVIIVGGIAFSGGGA